MCEIKVVQGPREIEIQTIHRESEGPSLVAFIFIDKEENISQFDDEPLNQKKAEVSPSQYIPMRVLHYVFHALPQVVTQLIPEMFLESRL